MRILAPILAALLAAAPACAAPGIATAPDGSFTVPYTGTAGAPAFWCAAAGYATRDLGAARSDRLWRLDPPPRPQGQGIRFALAPPATPVRTGLILATPDDGSLTVAHGLALCEALAPDD